VIFCPGRRQVALFYTDSAVHGAPNGAIHDDAVLRRYMTSQTIRVVGQNPMLILSKDQGGAAQRFALFTRPRQGLLSLKH